MVHTVSTPVGPMMLTEQSGTLTGAKFGGVVSGFPVTKPVLQQAVEELNEYFSGKRTQFDLPLAPSGTSFQQRVWEELQKIPYGEVISYGELARRIGSPKATRAVGMANHNNPLAIFIPCHRVVGSNGSLTGYAGGLEIKRFLLNLECFRGITYLAEDVTF